MVTKITIRRKLGFSNKKEGLTAPPHSLFSYLGKEFSAKITEPWQEQR